MFFLTWLSFVFADPKLQRREVYSQFLQKKMHISTIADNISHPEFGYAVVLMLHGLGDDDLGFRGNIGYFAQSSIPLVIILPEGERGYWTDGNLGNYTSWALEAFELERERLGLSLSPCRTIVAGVSMGGFGAWDALQRRPHFFAAGVPICGGGDISKSKIISHIPIWAWHGVKDDVIHVNRSRDMYQSLKKHNSNIKYSEIKNRAHDVWLDAWDSKELWDWIYRQNR